MKKGDYHKNMNGENYFEWVKKRLIPTFQEAFGDPTETKMILVLDNAPYHHCRGDDFIDPKNMKRAELFSELIHTAKQTTMEIERKGETVSVDLVKNRRSKRGGKRTKLPDNNELRAELQKFLDKHPEYQTGQLALLFESLGYELIFTPPYTPQLQPIEMIWSFVKAYVASNYKVGRTLQETTDQLMDGFYGNGASGRKKNDGCTKELCKKYIEKCHRWAQEFIERDHVLQGALIDLDAEVVVEPASLSQADSQPLRSAPSSEDNEGKGADDSGYETGYESDDADMYFGAVSFSDEESDAESEEEGEAKRALDFD